VSYYRLLEFASLWRGGGKRYNQIMEISTGTFYIIFALCQTVYKVPEDVSAVKMFSPSSNEAGTALYF
jgi:hypothetical protein